MIYARYISPAAAWLEEASRQPTVQGRTLHVLLFSSLLDRVAENNSKSTSIFKTLVSSPALVLLSVIVIYLVFLAIYTPLYLASFLLSAPGSFALFVTLFVLSVRSIARTIMFPGSTKNLQKQYSADFLRRFTTQLESTSTLTTNITASLMLVSSGRLRPSNSPVLDRFKFVLQTVEGLQDVPGWISRAAKDVLDSKEGNAAEIEPMMDLRVAVEKIIAATGDLKDAALDVLTHGASSSYSHGNPQCPTLLVLCKRLLQASEGLKAASSAVAPRREDGNQTVTKRLCALLSCNEGPKGAELLSFPIMREQIRTQLGGARMTVSGGGCNMIDCMYVPASPAVNAAATGKIKLAAISPIGTVLFCGGNASLYETISQVPKDADASWVGLYKRLGLDVCFFNYRGYNRSNGAPSPDRVRQDGLAVARYLRERKKVKTLIVHGESIGGLVASHIASVSPVEMLICDRTFASLDAVAARLIGQIAFFGLRYIGLYRSDVVSDYIRASCPKIVLQDPNDEIIHNAASLKNGIATHLLLGDTLWNTIPLPQQYALADLTDQPVPQLSSSYQTSTLGGALSQLSSPQKSSMRPSPPGRPSTTHPTASTDLTETYLAHLCACLKNIARRAAALRRTRALTHGQQSQRTKPPSPVKHTPPKKARLRSASANPHSGDMRDGDLSDGLIFSVSKDDETVSSTAYKRSSSFSIVPLESAAAKATVAAANAAAAAAAAASAAAAAQSISSVAAPEVSRQRSQLPAPAVEQTVPGRLQEGTWRDSGDRYSSISEGLPLSLDDGEWESIGEEEGEGEDAEEALQSSPIHLGRDETKGMPTADWLNSFCSQSIESPMRDSNRAVHVDGVVAKASISGAGNISGAGSGGVSNGPGSPTLAPIEKMWVALARTSGGSGQLLGQALAEDFDGIRCWVCSLLVWGSGHASDGLRSKSPKDAATPDQPSSRISSAHAHSSNWSDAFLPLGTRDIHHSVQEVAMLCDAYPSLEDDEVVRFVRDAMMALRRCCGEKSPPGDASILNTASDRVAKLAFPSIDPTAEATFFIEPSPEDEGADDDVESARGDARGGRMGHASTLSSSSVSASCLPACPQGSPFCGHAQPSSSSHRTNDVGHVLPVHCGHNGFPCKDTLDVFTLLLQRSGLKVQILDSSV